MAASGPGGLPWSFSRIPVDAPDHNGQAAARSRFATSSLAWPIQAKLEIAAVDAPFEREADHVTEPVVPTPGPAPI